MWDLCVPPLSPSVRQVCIPWLIFGSSNRTVQPACIARDLVRRAKDFETNGKCVQRTIYETHRGAPIRDAR